MAKTKRRKPVKKKAEFKKIPDPKIPKDVLNSLLEDKIKLSEISNVYRIRDNFLWEKGDVQRYRVNVWVQEYQELKYCPKVYIKYSFFVQYNKNTKEIKDLTIKQTIDLEIMRKMF